jgi:hypothetical protein
MTLLRKCLLELRAHHQDCQMNGLNGHDIEDLRPGMHAIDGAATVMTTSVAGRVAQGPSMRMGARPSPAGTPA